jgi:hypothetical protein
LQEVDSKVINISCKNLFRNRAKINMFKPKDMLNILWDFIHPFLLKDFLAYNYNKQ